jgi:dipeptidyl aminopeptidase/acylaminoacyl peptidase
MQYPTLKKTTLKPQRYWGYLLAFFFIIILSACIDKQEILKEGTRVTIPEDDISMAGILYGPGDPGESDPAVIVLHGWLEPGENGADMVSIVAWHLAREGYVALALSMRGWPDTGGNDDCGGRQPFDVVQAVQWLSRQPGVNPDRIGLLGFSQGGQVALLAAGLTPKVKAVVAFFPVTNLERWAQTTQTPGIKDAYVPEVCAKDLGLKAKSPINGACAINAPTLLIHGEQDTRVPMDQSLEMAKAMMDCGKKVQLQLVKDGEHTLKKDHKGWIEAWEHTKKFFSEHLKQMPPAKPAKPDTLNRNAPMRQKVP